MSVTGFAACEVQREIDRTFHDEDVPEIVLERMLHGLSCRRYSHGLEPVGEEGHGTSKSVLIRRFVAPTERQLAGLLARPLGALDLVMLMIKGIVLADHTVVCASGIDRGGRKHALGLFCKALLSDLADGGFGW